MEQIAWHKAGIIKRGAPAITTATQLPGVLQMLQQEAAQKGTKLQVIAEVRHRPIPNKNGRECIFISSARDMVPH